MKQLFLKRHLLFFITVAVLLLCNALILKNCFLLYKGRIVLQENVAALTNTLTVRRVRLPNNHIDTERHMRNDLIQYKAFVAKSWPKMAKLAHESDLRSIPPNSVAAFFEISDYLMWARESCDALGVEFDPACSFGFRDFFEKNESPLVAEIYDIHRQQEQLRTVLFHLFEARSSFLKLFSVEREDLSHAAYFESNDVFFPDVRHVERAKSYVYRIKFATFTNSFRNFLKALYSNEIPVIFRHIQIQPNYTFKLVKNNESQILECLASTFSVTLEILDFPQNISRHGKKNAALQRKIFYKNSD